jgi:hypothetical protein
MTYSALVELNYYVDKNLRGNKLEDNAKGRTYHGTTDSDRWNFSIIKNSLPLGCAPIITTRRPYNTTWPKQGRGQDRSQKWSGGWAIHFFFSLSSN